VLYTADPDGVRAVLRDVFGWKHVDAGDGWLIFALPPAEVGVHPGDTPGAQLSLMCDDIEATLAELREKGVQVRGETQSAGWGVTATIVLSGDLEVMLYQPRHPTAV
jgi:predicted enzyme related to lactoylglutathione lyase